MKTKISLRNISYALLTYLITTVLNFVTRKVFLSYLGLEYLSAYGLFSNIISILSLAELGFSSAIAFSLYKPISENKIEEQSALMRFYSKVYLLIGIIVLILGLLIYPFLDILIKDKPSVEVNHYYFFFLANMVFTYFFSYKRTIIIADQKQFIVSKYQNYSVIIMIAIQILILIFTRSYALFLLTMVLKGIIENILISNKANKMYPDVFKIKNAQIPSESKNIIIKNCKALFLHKIGGAAVNSTSNIIISAVIGLNVVGLYSNYTLVINSLNTVFKNIFESMTSIIGSLNIDDNKKLHLIYKDILFANFWLTALTSVSLYYLLNPFISLWLGNEYLFSQKYILFLVIIYYINGMRRTNLLFKDALGLFWYDRYKALAEAIINITSSLLLAYRFGLIGIFIGNLISTILTCLWIEPYVLFKWGFHNKNSLYWRQFFVHSLVTIIIFLSVGGTINLLNQFEQIDIVQFLLKFILCMLIPNLIIIILFHKAEEFSNWKQRFYFLKNKTQ